MRRPIRIAAGLALLALAACGDGLTGGGGWRTDYSAPLDPAVTRGWRVTDVAVSVPADLTQTDANQMAPNADIVWHGEPEGDRRAQVARIVDDGITQGAAALRGPRPVRIDVQLAQFHAVTPIAVSRAPAAVHNITYFARVVDARSGDVIVPPMRIQADLDAYVGAAAVIAAQQGETQKVRITRHLKRVTEGWLGIGPDPRRTFSSLGR